MLLYVFRPYPVTERVDNEIWVPIFLIITPVLHSTLERVASLKRQTKLMGVERSCALVKVHRQRQSTLRRDSGHTRAIRTLASSHVTIDNHIYNTILNIPIITTTFESVHHCAYVYSRVINNLLKNFYNFLKLVVLFFAKTLRRQKLLFRFLCCCSISELV